MTNKIFSNILKKSPWDNFNNEDNIFTRKRKNDFNFDNFQFEFNGKVIIWLLLGVLALVILSGFYKVEEGEEAAVIRFGKFHRKAMPGLNYKLPLPVEKVMIEKVAQSRRIEIGYSSSGAGRNGFNKTYAKERDVNSESIMLTGDENIVELHLDVMWHISNLFQYLFYVNGPEETIKSVSESAIREVIGNTPIASVLSNQKQEIADKTEVLIKQILKQYEIGIEIEQVKLLKAEPPKEVIQAYRDVQTAKADKEKEINEAESYMNNLIPRARGEGAKIEQESEGYAAEIVAKAEGDSDRFKAIYKEYAMNKDVTRNRLYIDALKEILRDSSKVIMEGNGLLPHMALQQKN